MAMAGFTALEQDELRRLERCDDEVLRLRIAVGELQAVMSELQVRLDAVERARNQIVGGA